MRRRVQEQQLGDAEPQDVVHCAARGGSGVARQCADQRVDLAEPPQHRRDQQPRESPVAQRQLRHRGSVVDRIVERALAPQDRPDQVERDVASR